MVKHALLQLKENTLGVQSFGCLKIWYTDGGYDLILSNSVWSPEGVLEDGIRNEPDLFNVPVEEEIIYTNGPFSTYSNDAERNSVQYLESLNGGNPYHYERLINRAKISK